ncbi:MAG: RNA recognition motif domain-containing protein [Desulfitobacteriia bacterium]|jgi:RNA recognition motif-containing protein
MTKTLYVGNLPWSTSSEELTEHFSQYGNVISSRIITDRETGRSRGFGFVEVASEDAERLTEALNGTDFNGRSLTVNEARPRQTL